ncbi:helix-turn-helix domain-containing protein [Defluviimonas salinarum]|uniref:Helix-turn-helix domain-containing protein n=1 Tax=Defluviimonas salinarum TaxID=2992147 RepID=A0ABT3J952_9RHOB|nr:helix-turn-helix domain-containing protein [Defluviimonas salinarum]MCW3784196.1 helix-turn-helix domain-containing protein [Defluviimonas salinarum]
MTSQPDPREFVGVGLYTITDAAQLLKAPPRTIRRWMEGYDYSREGERRHVEPLWRPDLPEIDGEVEISFRDLIELRFVRAFTEIGLGLKAIRNCLDVARDCIGSDRPFSTGRFRTDGKTIFLESLGHSEDPKLLDLRKTQYVFRDVVEQTFRDLDLEDDMVARWRPYRGKETIVVDPARAFGQPIATAFGVPTIVLFEAARAEGSAARAAALYEVDPAVVRDAVRFHEELAAA